MPLLIHYNGPVSRAHNALNIALHAVIYLAIIMNQYEGPHSALTRALYGGLC
jgi:hypothetical protein